MRPYLLPLLAVALVACRDRPSEPDPSARASAGATAPRSSKVVEAEFGAMGTSVAFKIWTDREAAAKAAMLDALAEIQRIEAMMTTWKDTSEVSRINAAAGGAPVEVSRDLVDVLLAARSIHDESGGVFDVSFYGLKGLWHFDQDAVDRIPSDADIKARLPLVDGAKIEVDVGKRTVRLPVVGMAINLGGIAKGYAVDRAAAVLARDGFVDVVVQAGGDLLVKGRKGQADWQVGIRDPRADAGEFFAIAPVRDAAFSTAGDYERSFVKDGKRYHHILDPRTGYPATACRSVTILAPDALTADELDDAVFILGPEKGLALVEAHPDVGAVVVDKDNHVVVSRRLEGVVQILHPPTAGI